MIPKIYCATSHYAGKTVQTGSYLSRINANCLVRLEKLEITHSIKRELEAVEHEFRYKIHEEVESQYQALPDSDIFRPNNSEQAQERAKGHQIASALWSAMSFEEFYSVTVSGMSLEAAINPSHKQFLISAFQQICQTITAEEKQNLLKVLHPKVWDQFELTLTNGEKKISLESEKQNLPQLQSEHVLAFLDYCNSRTKNFNGVNDSKRLIQLCHLDTLSKLTACLTNPLNEELKILSVHKNFQYEGPAFKGLIMANGAGQYRLSCMLPGERYISPHWISATSNEACNYASNTSKALVYNPLDRDTQLTIAHTKGVKAHLFNDVRTMKQCEVILPRKQLVFLSPDEVEKKSSTKPVNTTIYCTTAPEYL